MSDKDFKVKNKLQVKGITSPGPITSDSSGNIDSVEYLVTQYGGTGTTTSPSSGQVLYSSSGTSYAPTTLTSLDVKGATYSDNAPSSPVVGQIWIESDSSSDAFDPNIMRRKSFTATAGQTVFTTDHVFIDGYEQVYFNGMLILRNTDYTTNGAANTVTLAFAAAVNDIVEVLTITNLNSIDTATTGPNTFVGNQIIEGALSVVGIAESVHNNGAGHAYRIRSNSANNKGGIQFTNNIASTDWGYIEANSASSMVIRTPLGGTSPSTYAWLGLNGGPVAIRDVRADGAETSDWPVPSLSIASFDDYTHNTMLGFLLKDDENYILDYSKWNIKISDTGGKTTSASTTNLHFGGPGAMNLYTGNAERINIQNNGNISIGGAANPGDTLRFFDIYNTNSGNSAGSIIRLITNNIANNAVTSVDIVKYRTGGFVVNNNDGYTSFNTSGGERMRILASGQVVIGSTAALNNEVFGVKSSANMQTVWIDSVEANYSTVAFANRITRANTSAYTFLQNWSGGGSDTEHYLRGDGQAYADGSWNGGGADYAEYFEWADGNTDNEDRRGYSVSLINDKIKIAEEGDLVIGVVSGNPSVVGDDAPMKWTGKYLKDDFGSYIRDEDGYRVLNPEYDEEVEYISRESRPEWSTIGLMGKLRLRKGQVTGAGWIKMRDISETVEEWLVK